MDGIAANHFPAQNALDCRILRVKSQNFSAGDTPDPPTEAACPVLGPVTPISAWLASVPIVSILRNDH